MAIVNFISNLYNRMISKLGGNNSPDSAGKPKPRLPKLKMVIFIVGWKNVKTISDVLEKEKVRFHIINQGKGTASSEVLDLLGIGADNKAIITCLEQDVLVPVLIKEARRKLGFNSPGQGIAFAIPLSAINDPLLLIFKESIFKNEKIPPGGSTKGATESGGENMSKEFTHDLILAIINNGFSDEFMSTAREAGAVGGTVFHARAQTHEGMIKRFGISVQDEKEVVLVLCNSDKKVPIMQAVCEAHGLNSKAQGIVFALPVEDVLGLGFD